MPDSFCVDLVHATGNQNVRQVLQALDDRGALGRFHTTIGFPAGSWTGQMPGPLRSECARRTYALPSGKIYTRPLREFTRLASVKFKQPRLTAHETGWASVDQVYHDLDEAVAARLQRGDFPRNLLGLYGYEDGCQETFRAAKERGLKCFYDLPIAYWETVRKLLAEEAERLPEWEPTLIGTRDSSAKLDRKARELALADLVVCPSRFVYRSLPESARRDKRCFVAEFGSPTVRMDAVQRGPADSDRLRVLFAGSMTQRKGLADLFSAMKLLKRADIELIIMGSPLAPMEFYRKQYGDFTYVSTRPHAEVLALMQTCDVLVLPSIAEGRALVQQEAMANGLPLIITENTGGEDLIVEGETGFLVPIRDPVAIAEKLAWMADHRAALPEMRRAALRHAGKYPWARYRDRIYTELAATAQGVTLPSLSA